MSKRSNAVKLWRQNTKKRMVDALGGKCCICGYNKCYESLDFHHLDPIEKEMGLGAVRANPVAWEKIVEELRKCICVCSNCHGEIHYGITQIPENPSRFNEDYADYRKALVKQMDKCPICGEYKSAAQITCSYNCAAQLAFKVDWNNVNLEEKLKHGLSYEQIGEELDCSGSSVKKRARKLGIEYLNKWRK